MGRRSAPAIVALAGPNGAGKSTAGPALLREAFGITEFVNADVIARGLSAFDPDGAAVAAGRVMIGRIRDLAARRATFAFETTLAGRSYAPWIARLVESGYEFHLYFLRLSSAGLAVRRVARRVKLGGHAVPAAVIRRRYGAGLQNLLSLYMPLAATWHIYDNSFGSGPRLIASGAGLQVLRVVDASVWNGLHRSSRG